jgi:hypothetical protein
MSPASIDKSSEKGIKKDLNLVPQTGYLFLDRLDTGEYILTHTAVLQRHVLPSNTTWELVWQDGFAVVMNGKGELKCVEDVLNRLLYASDSGEFYIVDQANGQPSGAPWSLSAKLREHESAVCKIAVGSNVHDVGVFLLEWPRGNGCRFVWPAENFYKLFEMTSYKGFPSKWAYNGIASWANTLKDIYGIDNCVIRSVHGKTQDEQWSSTEACLSHISITTLASFILCSRWAVLPCRFGGLRCSTSRKLAHDFVLGLLRGACCKPFDLTLDFSPMWESRYPRPDRAGAGRVIIKVAQGGAINTDDFENLVMEPGLAASDIARDLAIDWIAMVCQLVQGGSVLFVPDIMLKKEFLSETKFVKIWLQIMMQLANRAEMLLLASKSIDKCTWPLRLVVQDRGTDWSSAAVDKTCSVYVADSKIATKGCQVIGIACDKVGGCRGLDLHNAFAVLPDNRGFVFVPQVWFHFSR